MLTLNRSDAALFITPNRAATAAAIWAGQGYATEVRRVSRRDGNCGLDIGYIVTARAAQGFLTHFVA